MFENPKGLAVNISKWMTDRMRNSGQKCWVIGLSGGIDSAVSYRLAQMTPYPIVPVFIPSNGRQRDRLEALVDELIDPEVELNMEFLSLIIDDREMPSGDARALGNFHARMRMAILYHYSEMNKGLVLGTTNAPEWYVGYFTKWGDGGVDVEPLLSLLKSEVRQLGREGFETPVPQRILEAAPSANLWADQTDEGEMGFTYDEIDEFLSGQKIGKEAELRIKRLHEISQHKRDNIPHYLVPGRHHILEDGNI